MKAVYIGNRNKELIDHTLTKGKEYNCKLWEQNMSFLCVTDDLGKNIIVNINRFQESPKKSFIELLKQLFKHRCTFYGDEIYLYYSRKLANRFLFELPEEAPLPPKCTKCNKFIE